MGRLAAPLALALVTTVAAAAHARPAPEADVRLLVASNPPFVLDVASGEVTRLAGVPPLERGTVRVVGVGGRAGVVIADGPGSPRLYGVSGRSARVAALGSGAYAWPAAAGGRAWIQTRSATGCRLRLAGLDGRTVRPPRRFPCATGSDPAGNGLGLVVGRTRIVDPHTGRDVVRVRSGIIAVAGTTLVLQPGPRTLRLHDARTGRERPLRWPSDLPYRDAPAVDPAGRFVALAFAAPATQLDVWLLDARTGRLTQLPGMPTIVALKRTSLAWTDDGRLVLLGEREVEGKSFVAVWRPGWKRLLTKPVDLTGRSGASDSFAPLGSE